jgi:hypothetical protein
VAGRFHEAETATAGLLAAGKAEPILLTKAAACTGRLSASRPLRSGLSCTCATLSAPPLHRYRREREHRCHPSLRFGRPLRLPPDRFGCRGPCGKGLVRRARLQRPCREWAWPGGGLVPVDAFSWPYAKRVACASVTATHGLFTHTLSFLVLFRILGGKKAEAAPRISADYASGRAVVIDMSK